MILDAGVPDELYGIAGSQPTVVAVKLSVELDCSSSASAKWDALLECFKSGEGNGQVSCFSDASGIALLLAEQDPQCNATRASRTFGFANVQQRTNMSWDLMVLDAFGTFWRFSG